MVRIFAAPLQQRGANRERLWSEEEESSIDEESGQLEKTSDDSGCEENKRTRSKDK